MVKKRKKKVKKASSGKVKSSKKSIKKKASPSKKTKTVRAPRARRTAVKHETPAHVEEVLRHEMEKQGKDLFYPEKHWTLMHWIKKYSPVIITLLIGLSTYFYLVFYLFYPTTIVEGNYMQLLILLIFIFLIAGLLIYLGLRAELMFVRILSFIFVFVIFTFLLLFILLAHTMKTGAGFFA